MQKPAETTLDLSPVIKNRWSPRAFDSRPVEERKLQAVLEAARWAASAFNEQPWRFVVGRKGDEKYDIILQSLIDWNRQWAQKAPVLILNLAKSNFSHNGKPNVTALYDLGQAVAQMALEAVHQGLVSHQMSGFDPAKAVDRLDIPKGFQAVSVIAIGYYGKAQELPEDMQKSEVAPRRRIPVEELLF